MTNTHYVTRPDAWFTYCAELVSDVDASPRAFDVECKHCLARLAKYGTEDERTQMALRADFEADLAAGQVP